MSGVRYCHVPSMLLHVCAWHRAALDCEYLPPPPPCYCLQTCERDDSVHFTRLSTFSVGQTGPGSVGQLSYDRLSRRLAVVEAFRTVNQVRGGQGGAGT